MWVDPRHRVIAQGRLTGSARSKNGNQSRPFFDGKIDYAQGLDLPSSNSRPSELRPRGGRCRRRRHHLSCQVCRESASTLNSETNFVNGCRRVYPWPRPSASFSFRSFFHCLLRCSRCSFRCMFFIVGQSAGRGRASCSCGVATGAVVTGSGGYRGGPCHNDA